MKRNIKFKERIITQAVSIYIEGGKIWSPSKIAAAMFEKGGGGKY
jgi:hypothetical protein